MLTPDPAGAAADRHPTTSGVHAMIEGRRITVAESARRGPFREDRTKKSG